MASKAGGQLKAIAMDSANPLNAVARAASRQFDTAIKREQQKNSSTPAITALQRKIQSDVRRQAERSTVVIRRKTIDDRDKRAALAMQFPKPRRGTVEAPVQQQPNLSTARHGQAIGVSRYGGFKSPMVIRVKDEEYGRHIYIYVNLVTNQVVYSFERELQESTLQDQLTFVGKKSVPSKLRPDLWSCLAIVTFPTQHQGREAFRQLREFRMMHEFCWRKPNDGSPLPPKNVRIRLLQDQKANSIADLAAVLALQKIKGDEQRMAWEQEIENEAQRQTELESLLNEKLPNQLEANQEAIDSLERHREDQDTAQQALADKQIQPLRASRGNLLRQATRTEQELDLIKTLSKTELDTKPNRKGKETAPVATSENDGESYSQEYRLLQHQVSSSKLAALFREYRRFPKRGPERLRILRELHPDRLPAFWMNGVHVMWADSIDADYAQKWPEGVLHEEMGYIHRNPPDPDLLRLWWHRAHHRTTGQADDTPQQLQPPGRRARYTALLAKKDDGKKLTPEEEEFMKNVQLDGEDSGQGEDSGRGQEKPEEHQEEHVEKEKRRQGEKKKSLWHKQMTTRESDHASQPEASR